MALEFNNLPDNIHSHIPYNVILVKLLEEWREKVLLIYLLILNIA